MIAKDYVLSNRVKITYMSDVDRDDNFDLNSTNFKLSPNNVWIILEYQAGKNLMTY